MRTPGISGRGPRVVLALAGTLVLSAPAFLAAQGLSGADLEARKGISAAFVRNLPAPRGAN